MLRALESKSIETSRAIRNKLIELLNQRRPVSSLDGKPTGYIIKRRLIRESKYYHCHTKMLLIKEVKFNLTNEDDERLLDCSYHFCPKCGSHNYEDGYKNRLSFF